MVISSTAERGLGVCACMYSNRCLGCAPLSLPMIVIAHDEFSHLAPIVVYGPGRDKRRCSGRKRPSGPFCRSLTLPPLPPPDLGKEGRIDNNGIHPILPASLSDAPGPPQSVPPLRAVYGVRHVRREGMPIDGCDNGPSGSPGLPGHRVRDLAAFVVGSGADTTVLSRPRVP